MADDVGRWSKAACPSPRLPKKRLDRLSQFVGRAKAKAKAGKWRQQLARSQASRREESAADMPSLAEVSSASEIRFSSRENDDESGALPPLTGAKKKRIRKRSIAVLPKSIVKVFARDLPHAIALFEKLDLDASGELNESEFARGLASYGISESKARKIFREIDADDTGTLTLEELAAVAQQVMAARSEAEGGSQVKANTAMLKFLAEYCLSFLWRSIPDLAAETIEADNLTMALVPEKRRQAELSKRGLLSARKSSFGQSNDSLGGSSGSLTSNSSRDVLGNEHSFRGDGRRPSTGSSCANVGGAPTGNAPAPPPPSPPDADAPAPAPPISLSSRPKLGVSFSDKSKSYPSMGSSASQLNETMMSEVGASVEPAAPLAASASLYRRVMPPPIATEDSARSVVSRLDSSRSRRTCSRRISRVSSRHGSDDALHGLREITRKAFDDETRREVSLRESSRGGVSCDTSSMDELRQDTKGSELLEHISAAEELLVEAVGESVLRTKRLANCIRQVRLATLHMKASNRLEARERRLELEQHYTLTEMLWKSVQGSLVRQQPFSSRDAWLEFVPNTRVYTNQRVAQFIAGYMLLWLAVFSIIWLSLEPIGGHMLRHNGTEVVFDDEGERRMLQGSSTDEESEIIRRPLHLFMCDEDLGETAILVNATFSIITCLFSVVVFALSIDKNIFWLGVPWGYLHPTQAVLPLFSVLLRTIIVIQVYTNQLYEDDDDSDIDEKTMCVMSAVGVNLTYFFVFLTFVISDLWLKPAPTLRLYLAAFMATYIGCEIHGRNAYLIMEDVTPTGSSFDNYLHYFVGADNVITDAQVFIRKCDYVVIILMFNGIKNAIMRPTMCTTSTVPCTLENIRFFFRQEWRDRALNGKRRLNRLRHFLKGIAPQCCNGGKYDQFYGIGNETIGATVKNLNVHRRSFEAEPTPSAAKAREPRWSAPGAGVSQEISTGLN